MNRRTNYADASHVREVMISKEGGAYAWEFNQPTHRNVSAHCLSAFDALRRDWAVNPCGSKCSFERGLRIPLLFCFLWLYMLCADLIR